MNYNKEIQNTIQFTINVISKTNVNHEYGQAIKECAKRRDNLERAVRAKLQQIERLNQVINVLSEKASDYDRQIRQVSSSDTESRFEETDEGTNKLRRVAGDHSVQCSLQRGKEKSDEETKGTVETHSDSEEEESPIGYFGQ